MTIKQIQRNSGREALYSLCLTYQNPLHVETNTVVYHPRKKLNIIMFSQDCTNPRYFAAGTSNAVKLSRFFDKVRNLNSAMQCFINFRAIWWITEVIVQQNISVLKLLAVSLFWWSSDKVKVKSN